MKIIIIRIRILILIKYSIKISYFLVDIFLYEREHELTHILIESSFRITRTSKLKKNVYVYKRKRRKRKKDENKMK